MDKSYYSITPANVRYSKKICAHAKLLYGEITALCNEKGFCWATNSYFEDLYKVSKNTISRWVSELVDNGFIVRNYQYDNDGKTILNRCLNIINLFEFEGIPKIDTPTQKWGQGIHKNGETPIHKNGEENNTSINTTVNNKECMNESYATIILAYTQDEKLTKAIYEFIKMRKLIRRPLTDNALKLNLNKLDKLTPNIPEKIQILEQSISNCYLGVFAIKSDYQNTYKTSTKTGTMRDL